MKQFEKNNATIAPNVLSAKKEKLYPAYISKYNSDREEQVILLMIANGEGCLRSKSLAKEAKSEGL